MKEEGWKPLIKQNPSQEILQVEVIPQLQMLNRSDECIFGLGL